MKESSEVTSAQRNIKHRLPQKTGVNNTGRGRVHPVTGGAWPDVEAVAARAV